MKYLLLIPLLYVSSLSAQNIEVRATGESAGNNTRTFTFDQASIQMQGPDLMITGNSGSRIIPSARAFALSPNSRYLAVIHLSATGGLQVSLTDGMGAVLKEIPLEFFDPADPTLGIAVFDNGGFVTRDNVANFTFYQPDGTVRFTISNSTGSAGGEAVSMMLPARGGGQLLLYNPRVNYGDALGSRARFVRGDNEAVLIHDDRSRSIKYARISEPSGFIVLVTESPGTRDEVVLFDPFGNEVMRMEAPEELVGATLSDKGEYLTLFSGNRVQVYRVSDMERMGSASFRNNILHAAYLEADRQVLALSGNVSRSGSGRTLSNPELHAVHLGKRSIARTSVGGSLSLLADDRLTFSRRGANQFLLTGLNRDLSIRTVF